MGLLKELVLLPFAPVRGVMWVAERVADAAEAERAGGLRNRLLELEAMHERGELTDDDLATAQDEVLELWERDDSAPTSER